MERRVLLAVALSLLCILLYQELVLRRYAPHARPATTAAGTAAPSGPAAQPAGMEAVPAPPVDEVPAVGPLVSVDTDVLAAELTPSGGRLKSLRLKRYREAVSADSPPLELVRVGPGEELPLGVEIESLRFGDRGVAYGVDRTSLRLSGSDTGEVVFRGAGPAGVEIEKAFRFRGDGYTVEMVVRPSGERLAIPAHVVVTLSHSAEQASSYAFRGVIALDGRTLTETTFDQLTESGTVLKAARWGGFGDQYFLTAMVLLTAEPGSFVARRYRGGAEARLVVPIADGASEAAVMLYVGPKDVDVLAQAGHELTRAVDFGWFWFVAVPLLRLLKAFHRVTGNFGVDIVLLTVLIKVLFIPLTQKSFVSMREMQKLQPQMARIRDRFKDNPQQQQKEIMELYKRHRVNPLSGCLPMLLQVPVFVGLYNALLKAIELRHAGFALWITDLSSPDRLMVAGVGLPVLTIAMGASMLVQQWMTPAAGDPMQQRMMLFMPVIFTFMFLSFPSGLVLYWLVNNLLTVAQQYYLVNRAAK